MMDIWVFIGIAFFVGGVVTIYFTRKTMPMKGRVVMWGAVIAVLIVTVWRAESKREGAEPIWHPKSIDWSAAATKPPVRIYWNKLLFLDYDRAFNDAMNIWNKRASADGSQCVLLVRVPERREAQIVIRPFDDTKCGKEFIDDSVVDEHDSAPAHGRYCNGYFDIQMTRLDSAALAMRYALHEIGHGLGLDHDDVGAMARKALEPVQGDYPEYLLPSQKDVDALKARLCQ